MCLLETEPACGDHAQEREGSLPGVGEVVLLVGGDVDEGARAHLPLPALLPDVPLPGEDVDLVLPGVCVVGGAAAGGDLEVTHREGGRPDVVPHKDPDGDALRAGTGDRLPLVVAPFCCVHGAPCGVPTSITPF